MENEIDIEKLCSYAKLKLNDKEREKMSETLLAMRNFAQNLQYICIDETISDVFIQKGFESGNNDMCLSCTQSQEVLSASKYRDGNLLSIPSDSE